MADQRKENQLYMNYKTIAFTAIISAISLSANAQQLTDKETLQVNDSITLHVGNDILINKPQSFDFVNVEELKKGGFSLSKIANVAGSAGGALVGLGGQTASIGTMTTGIKVMQTAGTAASVGYTVDAINAMNISDQAKSIVGKKMRILKFKKEGNEKRGEHYYAIAAGEGKHDYKIEVAPAITSGEILIIK